MRYVKNTSLHNTFRTVCAQEVLFLYFQKANIYRVLSNTHETNKAN